VIALLTLLLLWVFPTIDSYSTQVGARLRRGTLGKNTPVGAGVTANQDALVGEYDILTVDADLTATAAGDLAIQVFPYGPDGTTLLTTPLPAVTGVGFAPTLSGGHSTATQQYNVQGLDKVNVQIKNNNAATQTLNASWRVADF